jgi:hypothetical protein
MKKDRMLMHQQNSQQRVITVDHEWLTQEQTVERTDG